MYRFFLRGLAPRAMVPVALLCATLGASLAWGYTCNGNCATANNCPATGQGCDTPQCCYCCDFCYDEGCADLGPCPGGWGEMFRKYWGQLYNCYYTHACVYLTTEYSGHYCTSGRCEFCAL